MQVDSVILRSRALTQILGYSMEVYKRECTGVLMGDAFTSSGKVVVNSAVALQAAERGFTGVHSKSHRYERVTDVLSCFSLDWILGEFHSHTDYRGKKSTYHLSPPDMDYIRELHYIGDIELVVALSKKKRKKEWVYTNDDCVLKGTIGNYNVEIGAFYKKDDSDGGTLTDLWCPIVEIANLAYEVQLSSTPGYIFDAIPQEFNKSKFRKLTTLMRRYEDKIVMKLDLAAGDDILYGKIKPLMKEIVAISEIYG